MNRDENILIAINYLYEIRGDWSDAKRVKRLAQKAFEYIPQDLLPKGFNQKEYMQDYIAWCQKDGRHARDDSDLNYNDLLKLVNQDNITQEVNDYIEKAFSYPILFK